MDLKTSQPVQRNRFLKLSLKKNREKIDNETKKTFRDSDIIILDESFENLRSEFPKKVNPSIDSPVLINDSCDDLFDELLTNKEPSKSGNVSLNITNEFKSPVAKNSRPSIGGWSPAQNIICATPKHDTVPSTPQDKANESLSQCSIKKIQNSHQKLLSDLYGETWKSIPSLFKTIQQSHDNLNVISKKLHFDDDDDSDKENIRSHIKKNKELYLTDSEIKKKKDLSDFERRSKKKLYTEKIPSIPDPVPETPKDKLIKLRNVNSTTKKTKGLSVTDLVKVMGNDIDFISKKVKNVTVTPKSDIKRLSFIGSLADNVPSWRCHPEALQYHDNYNKLREQLTRRLYTEFNKVVFDDGLEADMPILWDSKLRSTAGTTTNKLIKTARGDKIRVSSIKLSTKVLDAVQRLRDTLIHELCHAATWIIDGELRAGHGPLWKKWASKALRKFPELGEISRCHDMEIHYKYSYKCTKCGYSIKRHSKSIDTTKKCCGYCRGTFEVIVNKKNKDGVVVSTPARKGGLNDFALFVKQNYGSLKDGRTHAQVMKLLSEQFSAKKTKMQKVFELDSDESES
ncbi:acidic repeat-containing protein-like [Melitaea cinxia]|uniref:acidic repeat-containing protein-like n=1 Tax=Melitaea cinxia TaxID=113334 RepID=UPI001E273D9C|nr:acidic repeat-containing protein-like [Melitaea cinxia]